MNWIDFLACFGIAYFAFTLGLWFGVAVGVIAKTEESKHSEKIDYFSKRLGLEVFLRAFFLIVCVFVAVML